MEVPTIVSFSSLHEYAADIPVPHGPGGRGGGRGLPGLRPGPVAAAASSHSSGGVDEVFFFTVFSHFSPNLKNAPFESALGVGTEASHLAHVDLGPFLWRDEAGFEWVQMASGRWYRVDNPAVHWDAPG